VLAQHLNSFIRHADIVKMANITMLSSLVGSSPEGDFKNALFLAFYLYSNNCHGISLDVYIACEKYNNKIFNDVPYLDVTAVLNDSTRMLVVNVINRHETNAMPADIIMQSGNFTGVAKANELNGKSLTTRTTRTEEPVSISTREVKFRGNKISYSFPAHSFTQFEIPVK
jgi:alpha-N-arabinofuranosidase